MADFEFFTFYGTYLCNLNDTLNVPCATTVNSTMIKGYVGSCSGSLISVCFPWLTGMIMHSMDDADPHVDDTDLFATSCMTYNQDITHWSSPQLLPVIVTWRC